MAATSKGGVFKPNQPPALPESTRVRLVMSKQQYDALPDSIVVVRELCGAPSAARGRARSR